ncbi:hypothetical protein [Massilia antarctica]|uniref:hypothetical protein n=1 Tax=Massilia antarctica TaxID=2765360 RepID=UPI0011AF7126|nr:hypothetical protein [Massilia sp. H27-R4]
MIAMPIYAVTPIVFAGAQWADRGTSDMVRVSALPQLLTAAGQPAGILQRPFAQNNIPAGHTA